MRLVSTVIDLAKGVGSLVGVRAGTEEPRYHVEERIHRLEIRRYAPRVAAQTTVPGDEERARNTGFRRLAGYIFGANTSNSKISMTAPVSQEPRPDSSWIIRFYMPSRWAIGALPTPENRDIELVAVPRQTIAALRFTGDRGRAATASRAAELLRALENTSWVPSGEPSAWFYDPPWTIPFLRRNEVVIPVTARGGAPFYRRSTSGFGSYGSCSCSD